MKARMTSYLIAGFLPFFLAALPLAMTPDAMAVPFEPPLTYEVEHAPSSVSVGDLNKDGVPDSIITSERDRSVSVLLGLGGGVFSAAISYPVGRRPIASVVGDFDRDGNPDVATANLQDGSVSVLSGDGTGLLGAPREIVIGGSECAPTWLGAGDLDGDFINDLVVLASPRVVILPGAADGSFGAPRTILLANGLQRGVLADVNRDRLLDLAATNVLRDEVLVLLGDGAGPFGPAVSYPTGKAPIGILDLDTDRDGTLDLIAANRGSNSITVLRGLGGGAFAAMANTGAGAAPVALAKGDFDGDCIADLAVTSGVAGGFVSTLLGDGVGGFGPPQTTSSGANPAGIAATDLNGDSRVDLAFVAAPPDAVYVLINDSAPVCSRYTIRRSVDPAAVKDAPAHAATDTRRFEDVPGTLSDGRTYFYLVERLDGQPIVLFVNTDRERDTVTLGF